MFMKINKLFTRIAVATCVVASSASFAQSPQYDGSVVANITSVEASYVPDQVFFTIDQKVANCDPGKLIVWKGGAAFELGSDTSKIQSSVKAINNSLLLAMVAGRKVSVWVFNGPGGTTCRAQFILVQ
jgi:hypothetical protein